MNFLKLCLAAILSGALFGGGFVAMKHFAEWAFRNNPPGPPATTKMA